MDPRLFTSHPPVPADVAFVTCARVPDLDGDDQPLVGMLEAEGLRVVPVVWDEEDFDPGRARLFVVRSTWDYHLDRDRFLAWAELVASRRMLLNPLRVLRWNTHKSYLRELAARGVPTVETEWIDRGSTLDLSALLVRRGWTDAVAKPAVSAGAFKTTRIRDDAASASRVAALVTERDTMIQPLLPSIDVRGEHSYVFLDGEFSHAVRRESGMASPGGFAASHPLAPERRELDLARDALGSLRSEVLYARVDLVADGAETRVLELELVEPSLFFHHAPEARARFVGAIVRRLRAS